MYFLDRSDLWNTTKPYVLQYYPKEDFARHNLKHEIPYTTRLQDMRSRIPAVSLDTEGFEFRELDSKMEYVDFEDDAKIEATYCRELEECLLGELGAKHVRALDFQVGDCNCGRGLFILTRLR